MWFLLIVLIGVVWYLLTKKPAPKRSNIGADQKTGVTFTITTTTSGADPAAATVVITDASSVPDDGGDKDAWEGSFYDVVEQRRALKTVCIDYKDTWDQVTRRVVDIRAYEPGGSSGLVIGHCHLRNATRTFRFDRMQRVADAATGEIIPDLQKLLNDDWAASPEPVLDQLNREHHDVLKLLLYMAKADGAVRAAEVAVIAQYCQAVTGDARITPALVKEMLQTVDIVSITTFTRTYNKLRRERPDSAVQAAEACRAIVATQKAIHPAEQAALDVLAKPLPKQKA